MIMLKEFFVSLWNVLAMMAPWLLGGFLAAGILSVFLPMKWVSKTMGKARGWRGVLNAVLIGVPLPVCSCGVLPLTAQLRKAGAGKGAVAGFLISTPQTGVDSMLATYSLMGPVFAIVRPLAAFLTGIVGGVAVDLAAGREAEQAPAEAPKKKCCCCHCHKEGAAEAAPAAKPSVLKQILEKAFGNLLGDISRPLAIGLLVSAIVTLAVPENFFATAFGGNDWAVMPLMVLIGFPMYVCSTASIPIAASLLTKGISPGAALVFLMVGPAINAASLATVATLIGRKATIVYALVIALGSILCGVLLNALPFDILPQVSACCEHETIPLYKHIAAAILVVLMGYHLIRGDRD